MQSKGIVKFFLVALAVVSLIQLIYMIPTARVESKAAAYAAEATVNIPEAQKPAAIRLAKAKYLDSISSEKIFSIPLLKSYTYQELKKSQLGFGLDLKGGMSVLLQVDLKDYVRTMAGGNSDPTVETAITNAAAKQATTEADFISLFAQEWTAASGGKPLNTVFKRNESLSDKINANSSDADVTAVLRSGATQTVDLTYKLLKERIDKMGVVGPNVSLDASRDLILAELPGVENPQRAREMLQSAAKLEFWNVYRVSDPGIMPAFNAANEKLKKLGNAPSTTTTTPNPVDTGSTAATNPIDTGVVAEKDTTQIDTTSPASLVQQGPLFDILSLNNTGSFGAAPMGTASKNKRKVITDMLNRPGVKELFPTDAMFLWSREPAKGSKDFKVEDGTYELYLIKKERGRENAPLEGDRVTESYASPDPSTGELSITLKMDPEGARIWGIMTQKAAADQNREIAIVLDSQVVSAPRVINPILTGDSNITGSFTVQEAQDIANILQIGKLPAKPQILQESIVGPSLGAANIDISLKAMVGGFLLVLAFMVFYYGSAGVISILVLLLNFVFLLGAVASAGTVLTLPGIAGIMLTIGMAVDANVIIFERIKEELRLGKSTAVAIKDGYRHSYSAIIDGQVTTLLVGLVLLIFGLGPIKGFAVVLVTGILTSLFTAVLVSRLMVDWWVGKGKDITFWRGATQNTLSNLNVDWMGKRKMFYAISIAVTILGFISFFTRGFDLGVDFTGGYSVNVKFEGQAPDVETVRTQLTTAFGTSPVVKAVDASNTYNIVTRYLIDDTQEDAPERVLAKLNEGLGGNADGLANFKDTEGTGTHVTAFNKVGPTVADDLSRSAWKAIVFGLLVIFLYILIRFSKWQYSLGAVIATAHDALVVVSLFSLLHGIIPMSLEIDQAFIAAILTIIGYSVNDTVIVYDRIREYFGLYPEKSKEEVINMAINSTMSRTLFTSMTTLFTVIVLFFLGTGSIKAFAFALVVGIVVGTYSSIFIASPVMADISKGDIRITEAEPKKEEKSKKSFRHAKAE